jgi:copper(I)-binding protein
MTPVHPTRRLLRAAVAVLAATALLAACGDDDEPAATDDATESAGEAAPGIEISGAWARTSPSSAQAGAVYLEITNDGDVDDALVGASVDTAVAGKAEVHETAAAEPGATDGGAMDDGAGDGMDEGMDDPAGDDGMDESPDSPGDDMSGGTGMMEMRPVDRVEVPAGETVTLEPGGYHIMLLELAAPLEAGTTLEVTLTFEEGGEQVVTADVRDAEA